MCFLSNKLKRTTFDLANIAVFCAIVVHLLDSEPQERRDVFLQRIKYSIMHKGVFGEIVYSTRIIYVLPLIIYNAYAYTYNMVDRYSSKYYVYINAYVHGVAGPLRPYIRVE